MKKERSFGVHPNPNPNHHTREENESKTDEGEMRTMRCSSVYMLGFNLCSGLGWFLLTTRFLRASDLSSAWTQDGLRLCLHQSVALLEIVHAASGLVPSPLGSVVPQVASRLFVTWGVLYPFPRVVTVTHHGLGLRTLLLSWGITETIRYAFYATKVVIVRSPDGSRGDKHTRKRRAVPATMTPYWLLWLRYSTFLVLYPLGFASEVALVRTALPLLSPDFAWSAYAILFIYPIGFYLLYKYMLQQRYKVLHPSTSEI
jgi:very-long-chain (3R)-3-hydroxyacyl-CoA dehydratase